MSFKRASAFVLLSLLVLELGGCSRFVNGLRRDLDDQDPYSSPTSGGSWSERGFIGDDMSDGGPFSDRYAAVGHSERGPASLSENGTQPDGWISPERADANKRDAYRGLGDDDEMPSGFSSNPDMQPKTRRLYKNGDRATRADFIDDTKNEGSLWGSDGQTNYYFTKNKVRSVGDIVSVKIEAGLLKDIGSETKRTLTSYEREHELQLANERIQAKYLSRSQPGQGATSAPGANGNSDQVASSASAPDRAPAGDPNVEPPQATYNDIDTLKSLEVKENDLMMAEVVERYPNGNYKIRASRKVPYKGGAPRVMMLTGIVRGTDIGEDDVINSGKLYEYKLEALH